MYWMPRWHSFTFVYFLPLFCAHSIRVAPAATTIYNPLQRYIRLFCGNIHTYEKRARMDICWAWTLRHSLLHTAPLIAPLSHTLTLIFSRSSSRFRDLWLLIARCHLHLHPHSCARTLTLSRFLALALFLALSLLAFVPHGRRLFPLLISASLNKLCAFKVQLVNLFS